MGRGGISKRGTSVISVRDLTKAYGQTLAVDHISFDVQKGDVVGFLGPNGAGKSTTMRMLTCYQPPTSGTATINGFDIFHQSEQVRENLGYLPENVPLYTEMKVEEYLDFRGRLPTCAEGPSVICRRATASASAWLIRSCTTRRC
jgi:ABC-2 type transport system ATP-binding protein